MNSAEPPEGAHVVVQVDKTFVDLFQRNSEFGRRLDGRPGAHWVVRHGDIAVKTWPELCALGPIAYVGEFACRSTDE
jgi:hypothetical protein